eukprot:CAMPEP_0170527626 /NCGR_PEP_ID=MMETSP0209-20121228/13092_1 /TAXON_ID=665100 ORGANISM="Litonotus pictus, Strain P1" /NCGR_SAMPLE_ID=MMETSP0209 /ASSEMBLY_ACC=CAM_ASM_000301 /LENGTH=287 /DNA_ID=CAMNT_0010818275 /DNA_START=133 /DNA_END=996 /DNA_ORIENTATION=+
MNIELSDLSCTSDVVINKDDFKTQAFTSKESTSKEENSTSIDIDTSNINKRRSNTNGVSQVISNIIQKRFSKLKELSKGNKDNELTKEISKGSTNSSNTTSSSHIKAKESDKSNSNGRKEVRANSQTKLNSNTNQNNIPSTSNVNTNNANKQAVNSDVKSNHIESRSSSLFNGKRISTWEDDSDIEETNNKGTHFINSNSGSNHIAPSSTCASSNTSKPSLLEVQNKFIERNSSDFSKPKINYKDKYDIDYDAGKLKKIKKKKEVTKDRNPFQRFQKKFYLNKEGGN